MNKQKEKDKILDDVRVLDLAGPSGLYCTKLFADLGADVMVETFAPGYLATKGLGYPVLKEINPRLILVSITGFGQTGPYKDFEASDLIGLAMSGLLYTIGFPEDPPTTLGA